MRGILSNLNRWGIHPSVVESVSGPLRISSAEPQALLNDLFGALRIGRSVALLPPGGGKDWIAAAESALNSYPEGLGLDAGPEILIPTGGTGGRVRFARHLIETLWTAAEGFVQRFGAGACESVNVLPLHHVGGLMPVFRALAGSAGFSFADYREIGISVNPEGRSISLVPTQLIRLLGNPAAVEALKRAGRIFLSGAAASEELLSRARTSGLKIVQSYGMTETAAMVAALDFEAFLDGASGCGTCLPHARISIADASAEGAGLIEIESAAICHGYLPVGEGFSRTPFRTSDRGRIDSNGDLQILGRADRVINTGGEKVDPGHVESVLRQFDGISEAVVWGRPHPDWGEQVVAAVVSFSDLDRQGLDGFLRSKLMPCEIPREVGVLREIPRTDMGKIDFPALLRHIGSA